MDLLAAMRVFVRIVERGNMSAAARDLGIGQPAVSERIERLEKELGSQLLNRNTRRTTLTDAGLVFYQHSKQTLQMADDSVAAVAQGVQLRGTLKIAAPQGLGDVVMPPILAELRTIHPGLKIEMILNDRVVDPVTEGVDVSLRLGNLSEGNFVARKLGFVQRRLVASPAYLKRHENLATTKDLHRHPFIRVQGLFNNGKIPLLDARGKRVNPAVNIAMTMSTWRPVHSLLLAGAGIGILQLPVCAKDLAEGRLVELFSGYTVPSFELHALYTPAKSISSRLQACLSLLESRLAPLLG